MHRRRLSSRSILPSCALPLTRCERNGDGYQCDGGLSLRFESKQIRVERVLALDQAIGPPSGGYTAGLLKDKPILAASHSELRTE